ncbi:MAG: phosphatase PAP2 family protein [Crocinitomicaceae bacterium]|nr:phosphatase PAP2 family protein [Crocinitomicaceae bacterium]
MFEVIENIDRKLFLALNNVHSPAMDVIMWYVSWGVTWIPLFVFICCYAWKKKGLRFMIIILVSCSVCVALTDLISVYGLKETVQRFRPTHNLEIGHLVQTVNKPDGTEYRGGLYSFVSSHAANFGGIAFLIFLFFRQFSKWWYLLFVWLMLISYSRIYLGVHYPADLIAGAILGVTIGYFVYKFSQKFIQPDTIK